MNMPRITPWLLVPALLLAAGCGDETRQAPPPTAAADSHSHADPMLPAALDGAPTQYTCGMHPQIVQDEPGQCPICGMDLTPIRSATDAEGVVRIDPATIQNIGVRTSVVEVEPLSRTTRTTGIFEIDEQARHAVSLKYGGWVERLYADYEGAQVRMGQPLMEVYSPELVSTQEEYLLALRNVERMRGRAFEEASEDAQRLVDATYRRLLFWDVTDEQIGKLRETGQPHRTMTVFAPSSGIVMDKRIAEGENVGPGQPIMDLVDHTRLWLIVDVQEQDLLWVRRGTPARIELPYAPGQPTEARIDYVYDHLDPATRTARARIRTPNPGLRLKAGMYATVTLVGDATDPAPVVPEEAVVRTGEQTMVILDLGDGRFAPVEVETGLQADDRVQILAGLVGGERIVTSAQFLIDSESRLRSVVGAMAHDHGSLAGVPESDVLEMLVDVYAADADRDGRLFICTSRPHLLRDTRGPIPGCSSEPQETTLGMAQAVLHGMGYTNVPVRVEAADLDGDGVVYQSPMHWSVIKDAPGNCDVCNMRLEAYSVEEARENLAREGFQPTPNAHAHD